MQTDLLLTFFLNDPVESEANPKNKQIIMILAIVRVLVLLLHVNGAVAALLSDLWDLSTDADQYNQGQGQCGQYRDQDVDPRLHRRFNS